MNVYVYIICIMNWPVVVPVKKAHRDDEEQQSMKAENEAQGVKYNAAEQQATDLSPVKKFGEPDDGVELRQMQSAIQTEPIQGDNAKIGGGFGIKLVSMNEEEDNKKNESHDTE